MAPPDPAPDRRVRRSFAVDLSEWDEFRQLCIGDHVDAQDVVAGLVHRYVRWPAWVRSALLREIREGDDR